MNNLLNRKKDDLIRQVKLHGFDPASVGASKAQLNTQAMARIEDSALDEIAGGKIFVKASFNK